QGSTSPTSHLPASSDALDPTSASLILSLRQTALAVVTASSPTRTFRLERTITTSTSRGSRSKMVAATSWYCHRAGEDSSASITLGQSIFSAPLVHRTLTIPTQLMDHSTSN